MFGGVQENVEVEIEGGEIRATIVSLSHAAILFFLLSRHFTTTKFRDSIREYINWIVLPPSNSISWKLIIARQNVNVMAHAELVFWGEKKPFVFHL